MGLERWDPFREMMALREAMDRLVQQSISGTGQLLSNIRPDSIPIDVVERDDAYEVRAALPGVKPDDIEVVVQGERLTIRAEAKATDEQRGENWLVREHRQGMLQRSITLPSPVSSEAAEARVENGVLALRLPKLHGATPRRISVGSSGTGRTGGTGGAHHGARDHTAEGDRVTEESQESFPASDPPGWTPEKA